MTTYEDEDDLDWETALATASGAPPALGDTTHQSHASATPSALPAPAAPPAACARVVLPSATSPLRPPHLPPARALHVAPPHALPAAPLQASHAGPRHAHSNSDAVRSNTEGALSLENTTLRNRLTQAESTLQRLALEKSALESKLHAASTRGPHPTVQYDIAANQRMVSQLESRQRFLEAEMADANRRLQEKAAETQELQQQVASLRAGSELLRHELAEKNAALAACADPPPSQLRSPEATRGAGRENTQLAAPAAAVASPQAPPPASKRNAGRGASPQAPRRTARIIVSAAVPRSSPRLAARTADATTASEPGDSASDGGGLPPAVAQAPPPPSTGAVEPSKHCTLSARLAAMAAAGKTCWPHVFSSSTRAARAAPAFAVVSSAAAGSPSGPGLCRQCHRALRTISLIAAADDPSADRGATALVQELYDALLRVLDGTAAGCEQLCSRALGWLEHALACTRAEAQEAACLNGGPSRGGPSLASRTDVDDVAAEGEKDGAAEDALPGHPSRWRVTVAVLSVLTVLLEGSPSARRWLLQGAAPGHSRSLVAALAGILSLGDCPQMPQLWYCIHRCVLAAAEVLPRGDLPLMAPIVQHASFVAAVSPPKPQPGPPRSDAAIVPAAAAHIAAISTWRRCLQSPAVLAGLEASVAGFNPDSEGAASTQLPDTRTPLLLDAMIASLGAQLESVPAWLTCIARCSRQPASKATNGEAALPAPAAGGPGGGAAAREPEPCAGGCGQTDVAGPQGDTADLWSEMLGVLDTRRGPFGGVRAALAAVAALVHGRSEPLLRVLFAGDIECVKTQDAAGETVAHALVTLLNDASRSLHERFPGGAGTSSAVWQEAYAARPARGLEPLHELQWPPAACHRSTPQPDDPVSESAAAGSSPNDGDPAADSNSEPVVPSKRRAQDGASQQSGPEAASPRRALLRALGVGSKLPPPDLVTQAMHAHTWQRLVVVHEALLLMRLIAVTQVVGPAFLSCLAYAPACIQQLVVTLLRLEALKDREPFFFAPHASGPLAPPALAPWAVQLQAGMNRRNTAELIAGGPRGCAVVCSVGEIKKLASWWLGQVADWRTPDPALPG